MSPADSTNCFVALKKDYAQANPHDFNDNFWTCFRVNMCAGEPGQSPVVQLFPVPCWHCPHWFPFLLDLAVPRLVPATAIAPSLRSETVCGGRTQKWRRVWLGSTQVPKLWRIPACIELRHTQGPLESWGGPHSAFSASDRWLRSTAFTSLSPHRAPS